MSTTPMSSMWSGVAAGAAQTLIQAVCRPALGLWSRNAAPAVETSPGRKSARIEDSRQPPTYNVSA